MARALRIGGIVLCGGKSSRMGRTKAMLPFGPELMLQRVVRILKEVVDPIVVVAAPGQRLPPLPEEVTVTHDEREGRGPLEGLLAGLLAIQERADAAYVTSCDVPLMVPAFVRAVIDALGKHDIAVPVEDKFHHPLAAVYRTRVRRQVEALLDEDRLRPFYLFEAVNTARLPVSELRKVDAGLATLMNLNTPQEYEQALRAARIQADPERLLELFDQ